MNQLKPILNKLIVNARLKTHYMISPLRLMPDFMIIGAQKAGTTSMYKYLVKHPCIGSCLFGETHFFDLQYSKGLYYYRAMFPTVFSKWYKSLKGQRFITGESCPYYLFHPHIPKRVFEAIPAIKIIVLLRNPIDRAYSSYQHQVRKGREKNTFEQAIDIEMRDFDNETNKLINDPFYCSEKHRHFFYLSRGRYSEQIRRWMKFFPREQFLFIKSEHFFEKTEEVVNKVFSFLELPDWTLNEYKKFNYHGRYNQVDKKTITRLQTYYSSYNKDLSLLLNEKFDWD
ncbi:MAG: sulfotransferase domain-containing protein [Candidatus Theseobacter exili]|nr:sulfotransferase domain-containing protein [Candidatus Theseobacter exili]